MPSTCCCVPQCHERGGHAFPSDEKQKQKWITAIKRLDEVTLNDWEPSDSSLVCKAHFQPQDYIEKTKTGAFFVVSMFIKALIQNKNCLDKQNALHLWIFGLTCFGHIMKPAVGSSYQRKISLHKSFPTNDPSPQHTYWELVLWLMALSSCTRHS